MTTRAIARSERSGVPMALVFLDLDFFKTLNERFGHQGGDDALKEFARRLQTCVRGTDLVARIAGDEFVLILEVLEDPAGATAVARKVIEAMRLPFELRGGAAQLSCSIGVALRQPGETDPEALLHRADQALYDAKAKGRNCISETS